MRSRRLTQLPGIEIMMTTENRVNGKTNGQVWWTNSNTRRWSIRGILSGVTNIKLSTNSRFVCCTLADIYIRTLFSSSLDATNGPRETIISPTRAITSRKQRQSFASSPYAIHKSSSWLLLYQPLTLHAVGQRTNEEVVVAERQEPPTTATDHWNILYPYLWPF